MPAYDRPIQISVPDIDRRRMTRPRVGAVIVFNSNDAARIQAWLDKAAAAGIIAPATAREYNSEHGEPVWYIP